MPRGIDIKEYGLLNRFKLVVEQNLKLSTSINKNYPLLSEKIMTQTGHYLSISTLKRTFTKENTTRPSKFTLNIIAQAAGLVSWDEFARSEKRNSYLRHEWVIFTLRHMGYKDWNEFQKLFYQFVDTDEIYKVMSQLVECAVKQGDTESLTKMLDLPSIWQNVTHNFHGFLFHVSLGIALRNSGIIYKLIPVYARHPNSQKYFIESFVDEDNLNGYYGDLMHEYIKHKKNEESQLFYHCLMCQRDFENGIMNSEYFNYLITFRSSEKTHFFPQIRRLALLIVKYNSDKELVDQLIDEVHVIIKPLDDSDLFDSVLTFCYLTFIAHDDYPIRRIFELTKIDTNQLTNNHIINNSLVALKIYEAFYLASGGKKQKAIEVLNKFDIFNTLFYLSNKFEKHKRYVESLLK